MNTQKTTDALFFLAFVIYASVIFFNIAKSYSSTKPPAKIPRLSKEARALQIEVEALKIDLTH